MDDRRFDELARSLTVEGTTRRLAVRALVASVIAGSVVRVHGNVAAAGPAAEATCRGNFCKGDVDRCRGGGANNGCVCYQSPDGLSVCAAPFGAFQGCRADSDCTKAGLRGFRCIRNGSRCAGGSRQNVCAAPCKATRAQVEALRADVWPESTRD